MGRVLGHGLEDDRFERRRDLRIELAGCRRIIPDVLGCDGHGRLPEERGSAGHHFEEDDAHRVDVTARIDSEPFRLFGRKVGRGSHHRTGLREALFGVHGPGDAEVGHLHLAVVGDEDVARLDVPVDDPVLVCVPEGRGHMGTDVCGALRRERAGGLENRRQRAAVDELHHDEVGPGVLTPVEDGDDVGMREVGGGLGLPAEPLDERPVDRQFGKQDLQCHRPIEQAVVGAVDLGHAPSSNEVVEFVALRKDTRRLGRVHVGQSLCLLSLGSGVLKSSAAGHRPRVVRPLTGSPRVRDPGSSSSAGQKRRHRCCCPAGSAPPRRRRPWGCWPGRRRSSSH